MTTVALERHKNHPANHHQHVFTFNSSDLYGFDAVFTVWLGLGTKTNRLGRVKDHVRA